VEFASQTPNAGYATHKQLRFQPESIPYRLSFRMIEPTNSAMRTTPRMASAADVKKLKRKHTTKREDEEDARNA
jgi:hypothetical protein